MSAETGRCLCGAVRYRIERPVRWCVHCHCESCRRACSAPYTTFVGVPDGQWHWTGSAPAVYRSSPGVERLFCATCGAQVAFLADRYPGEIHFYAAALDNPDAFAPEAHVHHGEKLPWVHDDDGLRKLEKFG